MTQQQQMFENESIRINFYQWLQVINYRKYYSIAIYVICIILALVITSMMTKKYTTEAEILINKSSSTNLSEMNPFILDQILGSSSAGGIAAFITGGSNNNNNELLIIKSPLVLSNVIKENDLKYTSGNRKGQYLLVKDFEDSKNLHIDVNKKQTDIIEISYTDKDPKKAFQIVKSIIKNYKKTKESMNIDKVKLDETILAQQIKETEKNIHSISDKIKTLKQQAGFVQEDYDVRLLSASNPYSRKTRAKLEKFSELEQKVNQYLLSLEANKEKYKILKEKYEWSIMIEQLSKNATNIVVLKEPQQKEFYEFSSPRKLYNIILGIFVAVILSSLFVFCLEYFDPKLTYLTLSFDSNQLIMNRKNHHKENLLNLISISNLIKSDSFSTINFNLSDNEISLIQNKFADFWQAKTILNTFKIDDNTTTEGLNKIISTIENENSFVLLTRVGKSNKELFKSIEDLLKERKKNFVNLVLQ